MQELKHPYLAVNKDGCPSYGGNQGWSNSKVVRRCGCGAVAATDVLFYLHQNHPGFQSDLFRDIPNQTVLPLDIYNSLLDRMRKRYFFLIPRFGMNGLGVSFGMNGYFRSNHISMRANWGVWKGQIWSTVERLLSEDIPVICAVGPNLPFFWNKHKLRFYVRTKDGNYQSAAMTKAHYVTITGIDERWLKISSWGREYYISREEYDRYAAKHSSYLVSNIVNLKPVRNRWGRKK